MRILVGVVAAAVAWSFFRQSPQPAGAEVCAALEKQGALRRALVLMDYTPTEGDVAGLKLDNFEQGRGGLPGRAVRDDPEGRWARWAKGDFVWRTMEGNAGPLRRAVGEEGNARGMMIKALLAADYHGDVVELTMRNAELELNKMSDEELLLAWLAADRGVMAQAEGLTPATREGLLLAARRNAGPAICFHSGKERVYLMPLDEEMGEDATDTWQAMEAYEGAALRWVGTLHLVGKPGPEEMRLAAARLAMEARTAYQP